MADKCIFFKLPLKLENYIEVCVSLFLVATLNVWYKSLEDAKTIIRHLFLSVPHKLVNTDFSIEHTCYGIQIVTKRITASTINNSINIKWICAKIIYNTFLEK